MAVEPALSTCKGRVFEMRAKPRVGIIGAGYVGTRFGRRLADAGYDVVGTTTSPERVATIRSFGMTPVVLDTADVDGLHDVLRDREVVALCVAPRANQRDYRATYLDSARNLIEAARHTAVSRVIYTGSTRVYAQDDGEWVDESSPTRPIHENARILLETEHVLLNGAKTLRKDGPGTTVVLRLGGIYGPDRDTLDFIHRSAGGQRDDGDLYMNRVHVDDIATALEALLGSEFHGVLNLCDDHPQTRRSFYDGVLAAAALPPIEWIPSSDRGKRVRNDLIKKTLGLVLGHPRRSASEDR